MKDSADAMTEPRAFLGPDGEMSRLIAAHDWSDTLGPISGWPQSLKAAVGLDYKAFEKRLLRAIHRAFGLPEDLPEAVAADIKHADRVAAYYEATALAGFSRNEAARYFGEPDGLPPGLVRELRGLAPQPAAAAQAMFLARFQALAGS